MGVEGRFLHQRMPEWRGRQWARRDRRQEIKVRRHGLGPPGLEARRWFSTLATHWTHLGSFLNTPKPRTLPFLRGSDLTGLGWGLNSGIV